MTAGGLHDLETQHEIGFLMDIRKRDGAVGLGLFWRKIERDRHIKPKGAIGAADRQPSLCHRRSGTGQYQAYQGKCDCAHLPAPEPGCRLEEPRKYCCDLPVTLAI